VHRREFAHGIVQGRSGSVVRPPGAAWGRGACLGIERERRALAEGALGGEHPVRTATADRLDDARDDLEADLAGQVLRAVREQTALDDVGALPGGRGLLEHEPRGRERSAIEREFDDTAKRDGRRARTEILELGLELAAIAFRDLVAVASGADAAVLGTDRIAQLAPAAAGRDPVRLRQAAECCEDTRSAFQLNVTEELALSALTFRLRELVAA